MSIIEYIQEKATDFHARTGIEPKTVYLGATEKKLLREATEQMTLVRDASLSGPETVNGLRVIYVEEKFHIGVSE